MYNSLIVHVFVWSIYYWNNFGYIGLDYIVIVTITYMLINDMAT